MKKELLWFQQNFHLGNVVYNVQHTDGNGRVFGFDYVLSDDDLQANAIARKRKAWTEADIVELHGTRQAEVITIHPGPAKPDAS